MKLITIYTKEKVYNFKSYVDKNYSYILYQAHRENGPAVIWYFENGNKQYESWYINGKAHRENGPAYISYFKNKKIKYEEYYLNNQYYSKTEFNQTMLIKKLELILNSNIDSHVENLSMFQ